MRPTKKITLSAMMCALSVAVLALGAVFEALDLTAAARDVGAILSERPEG